MISTFSSSASSSSQSDALKNCPWLARHHLDIAGAEPQRGAAAIHRGIADADDQHPLADTLDVIEGHRLQPVDADVDVGRRRFAAGQLEILAARRAAADEHRVVALIQQRTHALDALTQPQIDAHVDDVADLLIQHLVGEPERGDVRAHQAAGFLQRLENRHRITERHQIVGDRQRCGTGADAGDAFAVLRRRDPRQTVGDIVAQIRRHALQATDCDGLVLDPAAPAGRFAGPVADATENPREHVRFPVDHVGVGEVTLGDEPDVFRHVGMGRAGPLAIDDPMVITRVRGVGSFHSARRPHCCSAALLHMRSSGATVAA